MNIDEIAESRRDAVKATLRMMSNDEVKALCEKLFPFQDDPWREQFLAFLASHPGSTYYHARISTEAEVLFCRPENRGIWFMPGHGMGKLQERGCRLLEEITSGAG